MEILFESQTRKFVRNPLDLLRTKHIQNGQFVSIGYITDHSIKGKRRVVTHANDAELTKIIEENPSSAFSKDFKRIQDTPEYQALLNGESKKKTVDFDVDGMHIIKFGKYNFQWRNAGLVSKHLANQNEVEKEIRRRHGFTNFEPETYNDAYDENGELKTDWRNKYTLSKDGEKNWKYGSASVMPRQTIKHVSPEDRAQRELEQSQDIGPNPNWQPVGGDKADFYSLATTNNFAFRQMFNVKRALRGSQLYYVSENENAIEKLDRNTYEFVSSAFSTPRAVKATDDIEELEAEEREFVEELASITSKINDNFMNFDWDKIAYMAASTVSKDENGKRVFEPFLWINDTELFRTYPWLNKQFLYGLIRKSVRMRKSDFDEWVRTPQAFEGVKTKYEKRLMESILRNVRDIIEKALNENL